jgi:ribonuclease-3 family protein
LVDSHKQGCSDLLDSNLLVGCAAVNLNQLSGATMEVSQIEQLSPTALAYLGDAVYELYVRSYFLLPPKRSRTYHNLVVAQVRAESQAAQLLALEPYLTTSELEILRRGRNAAAGGPKRVDPKIYQQATSLETLMGYLYLTDPNRLTQLLARLELYPPT